MKNKDESILLPPPYHQTFNEIGLFPTPIVTDPNGSYTGRPRDPEDKPVQDSDDL